MAKPGVIVAALAFAVLLFVVILWMRGSSRGHRIIVETAIVLVLALPVAGVQLVADTNRALDDKPGVIVSRLIESCVTRRSSKTTSYHLHLTAGSEFDGPRVPSTIQIASDVCVAATAAATTSGTAELDVRPGRWGYPWLGRLSIGQASWTPD